MQLLYLTTTPSTMAEARALLAAGDNTTQAVLADIQTSGRGRLGRVWQTFPSPHGMACTFIIRQKCAHLPLLVSLSLLEALQQAGYGSGLAIKWPNDLLLNGRKVAGILCEGQQANLFLVGVGLNLAAPAQVPEGFPGTFLNAAQPPEFFVKAIGACLFAHLALYRSQGWAAFHDNYARACSTFGQRITWRRTAENHAGDEELTGLARGLTQQGHLELVADDGTVHIIPSGEIVAQGAVSHSHPPIIAP